MGLLIRSQDKMALSNYDLLIVEETTTGEYMFIADHYKNFGTYKTKERAIEVLDEIQSKISQNECLKTMMPKVTAIRGYEEKFGELFKEMIYEMPKE